MRISGPDRARQIEDLKKKKRAGDISGSEFASMLESIGAESPPASVESAIPTSALDALLAVQADTQDEEFRRRRQVATQHAETILDKLENLRKDISLGRVSVHRLQEISVALQSRENFPDDPRLQEIIDEIDLRAQVELAKYERSS